jgi:hypothetical protein
VVNQPVNNATCERGGITGNNQPTPASQSCAHPGLRQSANLGAITSKYIIVALLLRIYTDLLLVDMTIYCEKISAKRDDTSPQVTLCLSTDTLTHTQARYIIYQGPTCGPGKNIACRPN